MCYEKSQKDTNGKDERLYEKKTEVYELKE